jgi:hypothetical protein
MQVKHDANTWITRREFDSNLINLHLNKMQGINRRRAVFGGLRRDGGRRG